MSGLYDDEEIISTPTLPVPPVAAPEVGGLYGDDEAPVSSVVTSEPASLVSAEAKAAAKAAAQKAKGVAQARAKQAAQVAAAGLKTKLTELRGQKVGKTCKQVCASVVVVAVLACAGLEWHAHRSIRAPEVAAAPAPVKAVPAPVSAVAVVSAPFVAPLAPVAVEPSTPAPVVKAPPVAPVAPTAKPADLLAPKSFNPMSQNYKPQPAAPAVAPKPVDGPMSHLKAKSFNPMSKDYKPQKSAWEIEQEMKMDAFAKQHGGS